MILCVDMKQKIYTEVITIKVTPQQKKFIDKVTLKENKTTGEYIRGLIDKELLKVNK